MDCSFLNFLFLLDLQTLTSVMEQDELHTSKSSMSTRRQVSHDRFTEAEDGEDEEESNFKEHPEEGEEEEEEGGGGGGVGGGGRGGEEDENAAEPLSFKRNRSNRLDTIIRLIDWAKA